MSKYDTARDRAIIDAGFGDAGPWPLWGLVERLAEATEHLLDVHDCDSQGHEGRRAAASEARDRIHAIAHVGTGYREALAEIERLQERVSSFTESGFDKGINWLWVERDRLMAEGKQAQAEIERQAEEIERLQAQIAGADKSSTNIETVVLVRLLDAAMDHPSPDAALTAATDRGIELLFVAPGRQAKPGEWARSDDHRLLAEWAAKQGEHR